MKIDDIKGEINSVFSQSTLKGANKSWMEVIKFIDNQQLKIKDLESKNDLVEIKKIQAKTKPMTDTEIEETKTTLKFITLRASIDPKVINYIKKGLEIIVKLQVENIRLKKQASFYKTRYEEIKNKEK